MKEENKKRDLALPISIAIGALIIAGAWIYVSSNSGLGRKAFIGRTDSNSTFLSQKGVELPANWVDLGWQLVETGAIDPQKFEALYQSRGGLSPEDKKLLYGGAANLKITPENSGIVLNLLWALGLANQNFILEKGPISQYGDASRFASTGGWTLARGPAMDHFSKHSLINLTSDQQSLVEKLSHNIYRPCCDNSTYFPDCNHGMAMLGLLELMASQGAGEAEMYQAALAVNSYWFSDQYTDIVRFLKSKNIDWKKISPEKLLGQNIVSASAYQKIASQLTSMTQSSGGCGVENKNNYQPSGGCAP